MVLPKSKLHTLYRNQKTKNFCKGGNQFLQHQQYLIPMQHEH